MSKTPSLRGGSGGAEPTAPMVGCQRASPPGGARSRKGSDLIYPQPGWVEHDPVEIWRNTQAVIAGALRTGGLQARDLAAIGITNQRETTVVWDRRAGVPPYNALVWQDTRVTEYLPTFTARPGS